MIYEFKPTFVPAAGADATATFHELRRVAERRGRLNPRTLSDDVEEQGQSHALAWAFTWDPVAGMRKLHEVEAGNLLRALVVREIHDDQSTAVRALVVIRDDGQNSYEPVVTALRIKSQREQVLEQAQQELGEFTAKMSELLALCRLMGD
jgi:hypothetical protein